MIAVIAVIIIPIIVSTAGDKGEKLDEREQAIYQLVLDASYKFKNPSSVRVVSGKVYFYEIKEEYKENTTYSDLELERGYYIRGYLRLSATNGWGATTSGYYDIGYDKKGKLEMEDIEESMKLWKDDVFLYSTYKKYYEECQMLNDFDIDKVNSLLDKKWSD